MLKAKDIPDDMLNIIRETFERDPQVCELRTQQNLLQRRGNYIQAMELGKQIEILFSRVVQTYLFDTENDITLDKSGIPEQDIELINECVVTIFMACDIIETAIMDANDIIRHTDRDMSLDMFKDLSLLAKMIKEKMKFLKKNSGYPSDVMWADKCDNMYSMLKNKAKSIIRKRKTDPDWGKE